MRIMLLLVAVLTCMSFGQTKTIDLELTVPDSGSVGEVVVSDLPEIKNTVVREVLTAALPNLKALFKMVQQKADSIFADEYGADTTGYSLYERNNWEERKPWYDNYGNSTRFYDLPGGQDGIVINFLGNGHEKYSISYSGGASFPTVYMGRYKGFLIGRIYEVAELPKHATITYKNLTFYEGFGAGYTDYQLLISHKGKLYMFRLNSK